LTDRNYHYSLRNSPEERSSHPLRGGSFKSAMLKYYLTCILLALINEYIDPKFTEWMDNSKIPGEYHILPLSLTIFPRNL
jgi:hypothetical protein